MNKSIISIWWRNISDHLLFIPLPTIRIQSFETGGNAQSTQRQRNPKTWYVKGKRLSAVGLDTQLTEPNKDSVKLLMFQNCPRLPGLLHNKEYNTHCKLAQTRGIDCIIWHFFFWNYFSHWARHSALWSISYLAYWRKGTIPRDWKSRSSSILGEEDVSKTFFVWRGANNKGSLCLFYLALNSKEDFSKPAILSFQINHDEDISALDSQSRAIWTSQQHFLQLRTVNP